jgi:O-antigen ligase
MPTAAAARYADRSGSCAAVAIGLSVPLSVALDNVLLVVMLLAYAVGNYRYKYLFIKNNIVSLAALALFALLLGGTLYSVADARDAAIYLRKYSDLLFIPLFAYFFRDAGTRRHALYALAASVALVLIASYLVQSGALPPNRWILGNAENPVLFKHYLTHSILMAMGAFLFAELAMDARTGWQRWLCWGLAVLAIINVMVMTKGRTGQLILVVLVFYWGYARWHWRGLAAMAVAGGALIAGLALVPGPFSERARLAVAETQAWQPGSAASMLSSTGSRLEFYRNSLAIIAEHPLLGVGTGGFPLAYAAHVKGSGMAETRNPHNEYLHITVQLGVVGLAAMLYLFFVQWRQAPRLPTPVETHIARSLVLMIATGCLFNSLLLDHTEGLLYAWLTGLLYGGLESRADRATASP